MLVTNLNQEQSLLTRLDHLVAESEELRVLVGFFYFWGIGALHGGLSANKDCGIPIKQIEDKAWIEHLWAGQPNEPIPPRVAKALAKSLSIQRSGTQWAAPQHLKKRGATATPPFFTPGPSRRNLMASLRLGGFA